MTDMTQAPTPGPLSGDWPVVTDKWVETYCDLTGRDPDGGSVTFLGDGPVSTSFRDAARREIEAMLCAAPKSAIRSLAPTAPVETLGHAAAFAANIDTAPVEASGSGDLASAIAFMDKAGAMLGRGEMPAPGTPYAVEWYHAHATVLAALRSQPSGFLATLTDEQRTAALAHTGGDTHPQPSGETREAVAREVWIGFTGNPSIWDRAKDGANETVKHCWAAADRILALRPAPVASGGQHSSGEAKPDAWRWRNKPDGVWNYQEDRQRIGGAEHQALYASPVPAQDDDKLRILADRVTAEVKRGADGSHVQALGALSNIEGLVLAALKSTAAQQWGK